MERGDKRERSLDRKFYPNLIFRQEMASRRRARGANVQCAAQSPAGAGWQQNPVGQNFFSSPASALSKPVQQSTGKHAAAQVTHRNPQAPVKIVASPLVSIHGISLAEMYKEHIEGKYNNPPSFFPTIVTQPKYLVSSLARDACTRYNTHCMASGESFSSTSINVIEPTTAALPKECFYCRLPYNEYSFGYACKAPKLLGGIKTYVTTDNRNCSPECMFAHLLSLRFPNDQERNRCIDWTIDMLKNAFGMTNIIPSPDYRLLEKNGGKVPQSEWISKRGKYQFMEGCELLVKGQEYRILA